MAKSATFANSFVPWPAPDFVLLCSDGTTISLGDLKGRWTVLFLYPADDTPTCTTEACAFSEFTHEFSELKANLYGLSPDTIAKHSKFIAKYGLKMPLLSDESTQTIAAFNSWIEKSMYGRTYMGVDRSTFVIDPEGTIRHQWRKVRIKGHVEDVLAKLTSLMR